MKAFPGKSVERNGMHSTKSVNNPGMDLRDWFAGQALVAVTLYADATEDHEFIAAQAYKMADAMLAERVSS